MKIEGGANFKFEDLTQQQVEVKKGDLQGVNEQILKFFAGIDGEFSADEVKTTLTTIFNMDVKHGKKGPDGNLTGDELQQGVKKSLGKKFKEKDLIQFANAFLTAVDKKVKATKAKAEAEAKAKAESEPGKQKSVAAEDKTTKTTTTEAEQKPDANTNAKVAAKVTVGKRTKNTRTKGKVAYQVSANGVTWKGSSVSSDVNDKLNLKQYSNATEVMNALLGNRGVKNLSDSAKARLLKDLIHNNTSVFNDNGSIHEDADFSKLEFPKAEQLANYNKLYVAPKRPAGGAGGSGNVRLKTEGDKQRNAALAQRYANDDFTSTEPEVKEALDAKLKADIKAGRIPGFKMDKDGNITDTQGTAKNIDDVRAAVDNIVKDAKDKATYKKKINSEKALAQRYINDDFTSTKPEVVQALNKKLVADLKAGRMEPVIKYINDDPLTFKFKGKDNTLHTSNNINTIRKYVMAILRVYEKA